MSKSRHTEAQMIASPPQPDSTGPLIIEKPFPHPFSLPIANVRQLSVHYLGRLTSYSPELPDDVRQQLDFETPRRSTRSSTSEESLAPALASASSFCPGPQPWRADE